MEITCKWKLELMLKKMLNLTLELWQYLKKLLLKKILQNIFNLETDLFPCLVDMRHLGVRVDIEKANQLKTAMAIKEENLLQQIKIETGVELRYGQQKYCQSF